MVKVFDVAAYVLARCGSMTPMKLQKLCFYSQAWSLVRDGEPLFAESFEAWRYGPVSPPLYFTHQGASTVHHPYAVGNPVGIGHASTMTIDAVLGAYGNKSPAWLSDLTHREDPWRLARGALPPEATSKVTITLDAMRLYYSTADSIERRMVMAHGQPLNPLIKYMQEFGDDDAALFDELGQLDQDPAVANLSVS